jgi:hypothetical protein
MHILITTEGTGEDTGRDGLHDLAHWLNEEPELRGRVRQAPTTTPPPAGAMGTLGDTLLALVEPGGVAAAFAAAVIAWVQTRRGQHTVTISRPDGTRVTVSTPQVKGQTAERTAQLVRELAASLDTRPPAEDDEGPADRP